MRDRHRRPPLRRRLQRPLHHLLALRIERARRLVEEKQLRVAYQRPRNCNALPLAAAQSEAARAAVRVVAFGERHDEVVDVGVFAGLDELGLVLGRGAEEDVVLDRALVQRRVLGY